ncbi:MAG TPA: SDR family NAD(P)-dependent oxidoreductase, partial [Solirubrobacterales bacterium]|nr:SDR family NAD(P)-dependent oxidoreductase [Solirubrobacterales bacterium]
MGMLDGKSILITGAASGIGEATARKAAAEGAKLVLADLNDAKGEALSAELGDGAVFTVCDVTDEGSVEATVAKTVAEHGSIDGAFNCAGILAAQLK